MSKMVIDTTEPFKAACAKLGMPQAQAVRMILAMWAESEDVRIAVATKHAKSATQRWGPKPYVPEPPPVRPQRPQPSPPVPPVDEA